MAPSYLSVALPAPLPAFNSIIPSYVSVNNVSIAWRNLSTVPNSEYPLVYLNHFRGTLDTIDPLLASSIAATGRDFISLDNLGVGYSSGTVPDTIDGAATLVVDFLSALNIPKIDLLGFSYGGMVAQSIAENHPEVLNKLILAGTQSGFTEGAEYPSNATLAIAGREGQPTEDDMLQLFFDTTSEASLQSGREWWARIDNLPDIVDRKLFLEGAGVAAQAAAFTAFGTSPASFEALSNITVPVLITNGDEDVLTPAVNSVLMQEKLSNAQLHLYPNAAHGHLYQMPEAFAKQIDLFLREDQ